MKKRQGFIGIIFVVIMTAILLLLIVALVWDFKRFSAVDEANSEEELIKACDKYDMASIDNIPQKCFPYIENINVKNN